MSIPRGLLHGCASSFDYSTHAATFCIAPQHPDVQAAVAELQQLKERLAHLQGLADAFCSDHQGVVEQWVPSASTH